MANYVISSVKSPLPAHAKLELDQALIVTINRTFRASGQGLGEDQLKDDLRYPELVAYVQANPVPAKG